MAAENPLGAAEKPLVAAENPLIAAGKSTVRVLVCEHLDDTSIE